MPGDFDVSVHLHTILQRQSPQGRVDRLEVRLQPGATLADLLRMLEIELPEDALLLVINGRVCDASQEIKPGDQVNLIPALEGG